MKRRVQKYDDGDKDDVEEPPFEMEWNDDVILLNRMMTIGYQWQFTKMRVTSLNSLCHESSDAHYCHEPLL